MSRLEKKEQDYGYWDLNAPLAHPEWNEVD